MPKPLGSIPQIPALGTTPTANPPSGSLLLYFKSDGLLYQKDSTGVETQVASGGGVPSGAAGGSLAGTYPNPSLAAGAVNSAEINAAIKDAAAATASLRTLGTGATQAAAGNHGHVLTGAEITGTLPIAKGGTNSTATATNGGVGYGTGTAHAYTAAGTAKQVMQSNGAAAPSWATLDLSYLPDAWLKKAVRLASTVNVVIATGGLQTVDGVVTVAGDRVLLKNQTAPAENGIYQVNAGAWTRVTDADVSADIAGATVSVDQGTQGGQIWSTTFKTTDTLGTTAMNWYKVLDTSQLGVAGGVEAFITAGTTAQYRRGDKTWQTLNSAAVGLGNVANTAQVDLVNAQTIGGSKSFTSEIVGPATGNVLKVGDDARLVDVNVAHVMGIISQTDAAQGGVRLGSSLTIAGNGAAGTVTGSLNITGTPAHAGYGLPPIVEYTTTVPARPATTGKVIWQGQVDPAANALAGDSWWPTA